MHPYSFAPGTLFSRFFHTSPVAMTITRLSDGCYADINDAYARMVGVQRENLLNRANLELVPTGDRPHWPPPAVAPAAIEQKCQLRTTYGELRHVIASTQVEEWDGQAYLLTIIQDLTAFKRTEGALRASQARFRLFFESMPFPVFVYYLEDLRVLDVNAAAVEQYGYTREEFLTLNMLDVRPEEDRLKFLDHVPTMPSEATTFGIWRHQKKDGTVMDMEVTGYALELDGRTARIAVCQNVTEQLAMEAALRASEERHRIIAEVTNDVLWDVDGATLEVSFSDGMCDVFGYKLPPSVPLDWWINAIHPDERETAGRSFYAALRGPDKEWSANYRFRRHDGQYAHVLDRGYLFRDESGGLIRVTGAMIDVTRQVEEQEAAARAAMEERRRLARDLHDAVTQSLYSLSLLAEAARRHAELGDRKATNEYVNRLGELAQQSLKEMRLLVHEMRPSVLEKEGLAGALQARLDAVERHSGIRAKLAVNLNRKLTPHVQLQYYRVAEEALNNALKHARATAVRVDIHSTADAINMEISDNGAGFDMAAAGSGGLGLTSIRERVEKLGGRLHVETTPGSGTTIRVHLTTGDEDHGQ